MAGRVGEMTLHVTFAPVPSTVPFFLSEKMVSLIVGPVGSTKTTASIMKLVYHAAKIAPGPDGIRRSRAVIVRNTVEQLRDTTIPDFLTWLPDGVAGTYHKTERRFTLQIGDMHCDVLFRSLDTPADVRKLLSLQLTFAMMDEFRELPEAVFNGIQGRLRRYPSIRVNGKGPVDDTGKVYSFMWGASNPPDMGTFWEEYLTNPPPNTHVTIQPSGLSPEADWVGPPYLVPGFYEDLAVGKSQAWIDVYIKGMFGRSMAGEPVHKGFDRSFHVSKEPLTPTAHAGPIIVGMDFGLSPAAVIGQMSPFGVLRIFAALTSDGMGLVRFADEILKPFLVEHFPGFPIVVVGDPAGRQRSQTDERTAFNILRAKGFNAIPARTNNIVARVAAVDGFLLRQVAGGPAIILDPRHTEPLIRAWSGGYRFRKKRDNELENVPEKNSHSHVADAAQYLCMHCDVTDGVVMRKKRALPVVAGLARGYV